MAAPEVIDYPLSNVTSFLLAFLQDQFSRPEVTPPGLRWDSDPGVSKIRISGVYAPDQEKAGSPLSISIKRGVFGYKKLNVGDISSATPNTFEDEAVEDLLEGSVDIIITSEVASETSSLANFIGMIIQANRQDLAGISKFIQHISVDSFSPEEPIKIDAVSRRWSCSVRLRCNLYIGWIRYNKYDLSKNPVLQQLEVTHLHKFNESDKGEVGISDELVDLTQDFGTLNTNNPQFFQKDIDKGWYYVTIKTPGATPSDPIKEERFQIGSIVDNHTLKLYYRDEFGVSHPYAPATAATDVEYEIAWNSIHLKTVFPKRP